MSEPWVRFEDEHLLAVTKPAGVNTHRPDTHAQDGMHEWVQRQRPDQSLSILHRLDKGTSGLLLFGKTSDANRALTAQFEARTVAKRYELVVARDDRRPPSIRAQRPIDGAAAETDFERAATGGSVERWSARPHTGRTHQVRIHATEAGLPILGDSDHHGAPAARLFLHAAQLDVQHPVTGALELAVPRPDSFDRVLDGTVDGHAVAALVAHEARALLFDPDDTNAYLWIDRYHDAFPTTRVERLGDVALVLSYGDEEPLPSAWLDAWMQVLDLRAIYQQRRPRGGGGGPARLVAGTAHDRFEVLELGARYVIDLQASATSSGLFLDQRETRRHLRSADLRGKTVLNAFAHTGSLSVAAALAGAEVLTLDLSPRYLEWAAENLRANGLDPADHDAVYGDASDWLDRFAKKGRTFDVVLADPPSSSTARRGGGRWVVDKDLHTLVAQAARVAAPGGSVYVSTNLHRMTWPTFLDHVDRGLAAAGRTGRVDTRTLPLDHRSGPGDPPYLKAAWIALSD
ncbi:MAG: pseudouridine synthase [Acidimicrobiales bacterium]